MSNDSYLQPILGTDPKGSVFSVYQHTDTGDYHVFYGMSVFDVVPADKQDPRFRMMIAHLRSVGLGQNAIARAFGLNPRTVKSWSTALTSGNGDLIERVLLKPNSNRKVTKVIEEYIRVRFPCVYEDDKYRYSSIIRSELKEIFSQDISAETLRPIFQRLKAVYNQEHSQERASEVSDGKDDDSDDPPPMAAMGESFGESEADAGGQANAPEDVYELEGGSPYTNIEMDIDCGNRNANTPPKQWCFHLGLSFFNESLSSLAGSVDPEYSDCTAQWISQTLLGAHNLEQSKLLEGKDLELFLSQRAMGSTTDQRKRLCQIIESELNINEQILRWNFSNARIAGENDFYFDPHTKHYTGKKNILKGWCSKLRWAERIQNSDYAHTRQGAPVYLENTDNYEDMRKRFMRFEGNFRTTLDIAENEVLTWIIDRGIYSSEIFDWVLASEHIHLITWERDYRNDGWPETGATVSSMLRQRARNHKEDLRNYRFEWVEQAWPKNPKLRRLIVRATNPENKTIEVSILTDDKSRNSEEIIWSMFERWVQENDFKYLRVHFGIDQITSYASKPYADLCEQLEDRLIKNSAYSAIEKNRAKEKRSLGALLVKQRQAREKQTQRQEQITGYTLRLKQLDSCEKKRLGSLKGAEQSAQKYIEQREKAIAQSEEKIQTYEQTLKTTLKEVSRLESLVASNTLRLDTRSKELMDIIKITARNIFYKALSSFKESYNNYRDDHVWFRHLTQSTCGFIEKAEQRICYLILGSHYPKAVREAIQTVIAQYNLRTPDFPDQSGAKTIIRILPKNVINNAIVKLSEGGYL